MHYETELICDDIKYCAWSFDIRKLSLHSMIVTKNRKKKMRIQEICTNFPPKQRIGVEFLQNESQDIIPLHMQQFANTGVVTVDSSD